MAKLSIYRENTVNIPVTFTGVDLTGATVYFTVKSAPDADSADTTALIKKDVTVHTNPTAGQTTILLTPTDTDVTPGDYGYDIKLKTAAGAETTVEVGKITVKGAYTNRA